MNRERRHYQSEREALREKYLEECMDEQRLRDKEISELAQKMYNDDGHAGNIYRQGPKILRFYEDKAAGNN